MSLVDRISFQLTITLTLCFLFQNKRIFCQHVAHCNSYLFWRRFLLCHATPSPPPLCPKKEKRLLKTEQHLFHEIRQSQARLHFQEPVSPKFPRWNFASYKMPFIFIFHHRRPATPQNVVSGLCLWTPQKF